MQVRPSVVVGVGSSGCAVVSCLERFMYEVLGTPKLDVFSYLNVDTDVSRLNGGEPTPAGRESAPFNAYVDDLGRALRGMKEQLGNDIDWCPSDIRIPGPGAGNLRAGGRIMLFQNMRSLQEKIKEASRNTAQAAQQPAVAAKLNDLLEKRGLPRVPQPFTSPNAIKPAVYVVGTLGGGTGSGMCVDLGYLIKEALPGTDRYGIFFVASPNDTPAYVENSWGGVLDLEYFCENPEAFNPMWPMGHAGGQPYRGGPANPYEQVFLITSQTEKGNPGLAYAVTDEAPLVTMVGLKLAAELLGMSVLRNGYFSNINRHVPDQRRYKMFFNFNVRAVCYPKYDLSEAAAANIIEKVCGWWLDDKKFQTATGEENISEDAARKAGKDKWNQEMPGIWQAIRSRIELPKFVTDLLAGNHPKWTDAILHQFSADVDGTFFRQVADTREARLNDWKRMIKRTLAEKLSANLNLKVAEFYLDGMVAEIGRMLRYWNGLRIPEADLLDTWKSFVRSFAASVDARHTEVSVLGEKKNFVRDELEELLLRLEMFLMRKPIGALLTWISSDLKSWLRSLRAALLAAQGAAHQHQQTTLGRLNDGSGPILRISRSRDLTFETEVGQLTKPGPFKTITYVKLNAEGQLQGVFLAGAEEVAASGSAIFIALKKIIQPEVLAAIESKGQVAIVQEIKNQNLISHAVGAANIAQNASFYSATDLIKQNDQVPSFVLTKDRASSEALLNSIREVDATVNPMTPQALPMFDHMAIFYQESAKIDSKQFRDQGEYERIYQRKLNESERSRQYLDPLNALKNKAKAAGSTGGGTQ